MAIDLGKFEGRPVRRTSIAIRNTGDGLSSALKLEPEIIHGGEKRFVVLEVDVEKIRHDPMDDGDAWDRVHMATASAAAFIPEEIAQPFLDGLKVRIAEAEAERTGQDTLGGTSAMEEQHLAGTHLRKRKACPMCYPPAIDPDADPLGVGDGVEIVDREDEGDDNVTEIKPARSRRAAKRAGRTSKQA